MGLKLGRWLGSATGMLLPKLGLADFFVRNSFISKVFKILSTEGNESGEAAAPAGSGSAGQRPIVQSNIFGIDISIC
jgi:hypothetical protein